MLSTPFVHTEPKVKLFITFLYSLQVLLVTLKAATPSVARFCVCAGLLFVGFMFCGYIVLGPFHPKVTFKFSLIKLTLCYLRRVFLK